MDRIRHGGNVYAHPDCIDFSASLSPLGLPQGVREALVDHLDDLAHYPDPDSGELCRAIALAEDTVVSHVLACAGASDALARIARVLRPRTACVAAPTYAGYRQALGGSACDIRTHALSPEDDFALDESFAQAATACDVAFVCNPNNPTGRCVEADVLGRILCACEEAGTWVVLDESFIELTMRPSSTELVERHGHLILVKGLTKSHALAGLRVGYLLTRDGSLRERLACAGPPWAVSVAAQVAGVASLADGSYLPRARAEVAKGRTYLAGSLRSLGLRVVPSDANYLLFRARQGLFDDLVPQGVLIRPCDDFEGLGPVWYRIAVRTRTENERLVHALEEVL